MPSQRLTRRNPTRQSRQALATRSKFLVHTTKQSHDLHPWVGRYVCTVYRWLGD